MPRVRTRNAWTSAKVLQISVSSLTQKKKHTRFRRPKSAMDFYWEDSVFRNLMQTPEERNPSGKPLKDHICLPGY